MSIQKNQKQLVSVLLLLLFAVTTLSVYLVLGSRGESPITPTSATSASPSPTGDNRQFIVGEYDSEIGTATVAKGMFKVLSDKGLPPITGLGAQSLGKEKSAAALQWAASFAAMTLYWPSLFIEPAKDEPKWLPGYFIDFSEHLTPDKKELFESWITDTPTIIENMPEIAKLLLIPSPRMKFDYPAIAERGYSAATIEKGSLTADGKPTVRVSFRISGNMYYLENGKRMVMGIARHIEYDLVENPGDKDHPWLLSNWTPAKTYSTYTPIPAPLPTATPSIPAHATKSPASTASPAPSPTPKG